MTLALPADLEGAIVDDPDDRDAREVAADWLQQQEDPHGELIALTHSSDPHATRIAELQRELSPIHNGWRIGWRDGFVERIGCDRGADFDAMPALFADPVARFPRALELANLAENASTAIAHLANIPATLSSLVIRDDAIVRHAIANLRPIGWKRLVHLQHLVLHLHHVAPPLELPALEELVVYVDGVNVHELALASLPSLRSLRVIMVQPDVTLFTNERFPKLAHLAIAAPSFALDSLGDRKPPLVKQLASFELLALTGFGERDTRRFPIPGPLSSEHAALLDIGFSLGSTPGHATIVPPTSLFRIGRRPDAQLKLVDAAPGSYVELDWAGQGWWLRNNRAGALLDHCAVDHVELRDGDELRIHQHAFRFFTAPPDELPAKLARYRARLGLQSL